MPSALASNVNTGKRTPLALGIPSVAGRADKVAESSRNKAAANSVAAVRELLAFHPQEEQVHLPQQRTGARRVGHGHDIASDGWSFAAHKVYNDSSDEEGWVKLSDGGVLTYDIFKSVATGGSYAERYDPATPDEERIPFDDPGIGFDWRTRNR